MLRTEPVVRTDRAFMAVVSRRSGLSSRRSVHRCVRAMLHSLAGQLPDGWIDLLAAELPGRTARMLRSAPRTRPAADLVTLVAGRAAASRERAVDLVDAVFVAVVLTSDARLLRRVADSLHGDARIAFWSARRRAESDYRLGSRRRSSARTVSSTCRGMP